MTISHVVFLSFPFSGISRFQHVSLQASAPPAPTVSHAGQSQLRLPHALLESAWTCGILCSLMDRTGGHSDLLCAGAYSKEVPFMTTSASSLPSTAMLLTVAPNETGSTLPPAWGHLKQLLPAPKIPSSRQGTLVSLWIWIHESTPCIFMGFLSGLSFLWRELKKEILPFLLTCTGMIQPLKVLCARIVLLVRELVCQQK